MNERTKVVITGASGFVGKHLLMDLDLHQFDVRVISRDASKFKNFPSEVTCFQADLTDVDSLKSAFEGCEILIHMAAEIRTVNQLEKTNIEGTKNTLEAIKSATIRKVIHLSSVGVLGATYSINERIVREESDAQPSNEYERTKWISEQLFLQAASEEKFELHVLRPTNVFGEFHPFNALLNLMQHAKNRKIQPFTSGAKVNYVYVKDLTSVILNRMHSTQKREVLHVGNAVELKFFYQLLGKSLNVEPNLFKIPLFLVKFAHRLGVRKLDAVSNEIVFSDAKLCVDFQYPFGLAKGIENTVNYYKSKKLIG